MLGLHLAYGQPEAAPGNILGIIVRRALGRPLAQTTITTPEGQWLWDTRTLPTGLYTYVLRGADQTILGQGKLTLSPR